MQAQSYSTVLHATRVQATHVPGLESSAAVYRLGTFEIPVGGTPANSSDAEVARAAAEAREVAVDYARRVRHRDGIRGAPVDCVFWCDATIHCGTNREPPRIECRGCVACRRPPDPVSELRERLRGYRLRGARDGTAAQQAMTPHVLAAGGSYFLLVSWYGAHSSSRLMVGRANGTSPLGPYVDRQGIRMDEEVERPLSGTGYVLEAGIAREGEFMRFEEWAPPGAESYDHVLFSQARTCGVLSILSQDTNHRRQRENSSLAPQNEESAHSVLRHLTTVRHLSSHRCAGSPRRWATPPTLQARK